MSQGYGHFCDPDDQDQEPIRGHLPYTQVIRKMLPSTNPNASDPTVVEFISKLRLLALLESTTTHIMTLPIIPPTPATTPTSTPDTQIIHNIFSFRCIELYFP